MTTDLDERLADLRRQPHWPAAERTVILEQVLSTDPTPDRADIRLTSSRTPRRRRAAVLVTAAGLAAAACIAVPAVLPAGTPGSADQAAAVQALHQLAHIAAVSPSDQLGPHQYLHLVDVEHQQALADQPAVESRFEDWIRADGQTWQRRIERSGSGPNQEEVWLLPPGPQAIDGMTAPQYLDRLPTDPAALEAYVRAHSVGSTSADERVFVAVSDIVRRGLAKPNLRSAAIDVLAHLGHVRLGDVTRDSLGNPVQSFEFVDPSGRPGDIQVLMFDTRTAQITEERDYFHGKLHFTRTVPVFEVVSSVPAGIRDTAIAQK
ncbi:CU044_5270 family protein [Jatrophihabitans cynanchi]|jgi:hypothetical protein|uniref:CU044_5270 family protein n=1 Tax=Jatrophihabitans cynanchi TaxID=2944128 RepID=A0ABY7JZG3_9ACTN|nr:CU044_5270 family protein [Jatrophihabitans sp. SB3-54]WAX57970.1 CU044_5270 family protein [Jatrophihabitans sp. SB3-54]